MSNKAFPFLLFAAAAIVGQAQTQTTLGVGIGTPNATPHVHCDAFGNLKVKNLRVRVSDWPDYVFGEGHRLPTLVEVERYIRAHRHLPGMPSAAQAEQEGVDMGEMNRLLVQNVEELTLYVIDLQRQVNSLKSAAEAGGAQ